MQKALIVIALLATATTGCVSPTVKEYTGPSGTAMKKVKCNTSPDGCLEQASVSCGGESYQVVSSESHAGGLVADLLPGPVTWYSMSYVCGPTDGTLPTFPFNGQQYVPPPVVIQQPAAPAPAPQQQYPRGSTCRPVGNTVQCTNW